MSVRVRLPQASHPALLQHAEMRRRRRQDRVADVITRFAGSMPFVYVHIVWFTLWIVLRGSTLLLRDAGTTGAEPGDALTVNWDPESTFVLEPTEESAP